MKLLKTLNALLALTLITTPISQPLKSLASHTKATPLVMVPGTHAGQNRFDDTFRQLHLSRQSVLKLTVTANHQILSHGTYNDDCPIIVISFEHPDEYNLHAQANWFSEALTYLQQTYCLRHYNYVGHSNGGLVIVDYLECHQRTTAPKLEKLVTIGTPYNDIYQTAATNTAVVDDHQLTDGTKYSNEFKTYYHNRHSITPNIDVTLIYGHISGHHSDGIINVNSAKAGQTIFGNRVSKLTQVNGNKAQHSQLPTNPLVLTTIRQLLHGSQLTTKAHPQQRYLKKLETRYSQKNNSLTA